MNNSEHSPGVKKSITVLSNLNLKSVSTGEIDDLSKQITLSTSQLLSTIISDFPLPYFAISLTRYGEAPLPIPIVKVLHFVEFFFVIAIAESGFSTAPSVKKNTILGVCS